MASTTLKVPRHLSKILLQAKNLHDVRVASICGKALRPEGYTRPEPWPYREKGFNNLHAWYDNTQNRFDENTKVIFVEGLPAIGKTNFAQTLAEELDMQYFPMVTLDLAYITQYGDDVRSLDPQLPPAVRSFDEKKFFKDPKNPKNIRYQICQLILKTHLYYDALAHLFNTGQGIVFERSPYSDFIFAEAMYKCGYFTKPAYNAYNATWKKVKPFLVKPHLVIYLDASQNVVHENLKSRGQGEENAITPQFLETMNEAYKFQFLKTIEKHAEVLIYDWSEPGDVEVIVEDIERIDFDRYEEDIHHHKMKDWRFRTDEETTIKRYAFTQRKLRDLMVPFQIEQWDCPEIYVDPHDLKQLQDSVRKVMSASNLY